jgi:hypothetical protein
VGCLGTNNLNLVINTLYAVECCEQCQGDLLKVIGWQIPTKSQYAGAVLAGKVLHSEVAAAPQLAFREYCGLRALSR